MIFVSDGGGVIKIDLLEINLIIEHISDKNHILMFMKKLLP
jgi:hypothetical protein